MDPTPSDRGPASSDYEYPEVREAQRVIDTLSEELGLFVVSMTTRKVHRECCRFVVSPGSAAFPYADEAAIAMLPHCGTCKL